MGKSVIHGAVRLVLSLSLAACATPQKSDPVAEYCAAVAAELRKCEPIFDGSSKDEALRGECIDVHETLNPKLQAALSTLPEKSISQVGLLVVALSTNTHFLVYSLGSMTNANQSERKAAAETIVKDCSDFAAKHH